MVKEKKSESSKFNPSKDLKGQVGVLIIPNEVYTKSINDIIKHISSKYNAVCYVSLNKLFKTLSENLKSAGIKYNNFLFIDAVTKSADPKVEEKNNVIFISSASALTELSLAINNVLDTGKFDILFFDSLSSLLVYNKSEIVGKFVHSLINKLRSKGIAAYFTALEGDTNSSLLKECNMYVDNTLRV